MAKYKQIKVNLSEESHLKMDNLAKHYDTTIASLFRELAELQQVEGATGRSGGVKNSTAVPVELLYHLAKIGTNLNQIAARCNTRKIVDRLVLSEIVDIQKELQTLLPTTQKEEQEDE